MRKFWIIVAVLVLAVGVTGTALAQAPTSIFSAILAQQVTATNSLVGGALSVTGNATVGGGATVTGAGQFGSLVSSSSNLGAASASTLSTTGTASVNALAQAATSQQTVVAGSVISVTAGIAVVTAAGALQVGEIYTGTTGQLLTIVNAGTNAVTVPDTGRNRLSGALALGQYDTVTLFWYNGAWTQIATSNN